MDPLLPDFDSLPDPRSPRYAADSEVWLAGTYSSGWARLNAAAWSAAYSALYGASKSYTTWQRAKAEGASPAELDSITDLNYLGSVHGAALGAIALTAFAIESFIRTGFLVALELERTRPARKGGLTVEMKRQLSKFDRASSKDRLRLLRAHAGYPHSAAVDKAARDLIEYRNSLAHDSPQLHRESGLLETAYRDRQAPPSPYESLTWSHRPARLKQVRAAILAHDAFVAHALGSARKTDWASEVRDFGKPWPEIAKALRGKPWWQQLKDLSDAWESGPEVRAATDVEHYELRSNLARRTKVRLVDQDKRGRAT